MKEPSALGKLTEHATQELYAGDPIGRFLRKCAFLYAAMGFSFVIVYLGLVFDLGLGSRLPTGKTVFLSVYALIGWFILSMYTIYVLAMDHPLKWKRRRRRKIIMWSAVIVCTAGLVTEWLWADLLDGIFGLFFAIILITYRKYFLRRGDVHAWTLFYLAGGFAFLTNADKVFEYPYRGFPDYFYLAAYCGWAFIHCYMVHLLQHKLHKPWAWVGAALVVIYFPVLELPGELARQYIGRRLTGHPEQVYYTKLRPNMLNAVDMPEYSCMRSFKRKTGFTFRRSRSSTACIWENQGQVLRTPSLALWINEMIF